MKVTQSFAAPDQAPRSPADDLGELDRLIRDEAIVSVYQPIVELATGATVAYEALARGPEGSPLQMPGALFGTAARAGRLEELDWVCRAAALRGALGSALERPTSLFVNIEPIASMASIPEQFGELVAGAKDHLNVVFEFTERALTDRPAEVLRAVRDLRRIGAAIALDDVGVDPRSLALMPFLRPDVIKLDMSLVQGEPTLQMARTLHAVNAQSERHGTVLLAEGIETEEHLERALELGATHGQGWMFGRPAPPPSHRVVTATLPHPTLEAAKAGRGQARPRTPFEVVAAKASGSTRTASKRLLLALSKSLELQAKALGPEAVVISNLQAGQHLTDITRARYEALATQTAFVGVIGQDIDSEPIPGVRGGPLRPGDALTHEWNVCVVAPHFAAALVAVDLGDEGDDMSRRFDYFVTYDREMAVDAARILMTRIAAAV